MLNVAVAIHRIDEDPIIRPASTAPLDAVASSNGHLFLCNTSFSAYMLFDDGKLFVAGYNLQGQLGINSTTAQSGSFVSAKLENGNDVSTFVSICANGGYNGATIGGNAIAIDTSGNVWAVGFNAYGQLGIGATGNKLKFNQCLALSNIVKAELGGGPYSYGYALNASGTLYTWGYNGQNNQFRNNTTSPISTPSAPTFLPGGIAKVFFPKGNYLSSNSQLIVLTTSGKLAYAGDAIGQIGIADAVNTGAYNWIATPRQILDGTEEIVDVFVHGTGTTQRWFVLTDLGNLYACGHNADSIGTGGVANSSAVPVNVEWFKISFTA